MLNCLQAREVSIKQFTLQIEYENGIVFDVAGEFEAGTPMTWEGFHWTPGHAPTVGLESVCVVGTEANLIDALSDSVIDWIKDRVREQMGETA